MVSRSSLSFTCTYKHSQTQIWVHNRSKLHKELKTEYLLCIVFTRKYYHLKDINYHFHSYTPKHAHANTQIHKQRMQETPIKSSHKTVFVLPWFKNDIRSLPYLLYCKILHSSILPQTFFQSLPFSLSHHNIRWASKK